MSTIPNSFANMDWVSERAKCTPLLVFETLRSQVEQDMQKRNGLPAQLRPPKTFTFESNGGYFAVVYYIAGKGKGVIFKITSSGVIALDVESGSVICDGVLVISHDGQCRLRVGETECDLWQFRRLALHELFFINQEIVP